MALDKPLSISTNSRSDKDHIIRFWPGVVEGVVLSVPNQQTESREIRYLVTITSIGRSYFVPQKSIIPFRAYSLDVNVLVDLQSLSTGIPPNGSGHDFDPLPQSATPGTSSPGSVFECSPLELLITDVEIAKHIATTWTATDGYYLARQQPEEPADSTSPPTATISTPRADASHMESPPLRRSAEGHGRRYRGLWWGVERIWAGDLLVLSFPESSIKYSDEDSSCFAHDARAEDLTCNLSPEGRKPEEKRVFLKLRALEAVRIEQGFTALEAIGSIYRLAPSLDSDQTMDPGPSDLGLPPPPDGFVFRAVLSAGVETQLPLRFVRGRYYPRLLSSVDKEFVSVERGLKAMEGLGPAGSVPCRPSKHSIESRHSVLNVAHDLTNRNR